MAKPHAEKNGSTVEADQRKASPSQVSPAEEEEEEEEEPVMSEEERQLQLVRNKKSSLVN